MKKRVKKKFDAKRGAFHRRVRIYKNHEMDILDAQINILNGSISDGCNSRQDTAEPK